MQKVLHSSNLCWFPWTSVSSNGSIIFIWNLCFPSLLWWWGEAKANGLAKATWVFLISWQNARGLSPWEDRLAAGARNQKNSSCRVCEWNLQWSGPHLPSCGWCPRVESDYKCISRGEYVISSKPSFLTQAMGFCSTLFQSSPHGCDSPETI